MQVYCICIKMLILSLPNHYIHFCVVLVKHFCVFHLKNDAFNFVYFKRSALKFTTIFGVYDLKQIFEFEYNLHVIILFYQITFEIIDEQNSYSRNIWYIVLTSSSWLYKLYNLIYSFMNPLQKKKKKRNGCFSKNWVSSWSYQIRVFVYCLLVYRRTAYLTKFKHKNVFF